ncbi:MAG: hypothetical protein WD025_05875 [Bacteriovoracaceae bacterium]
MAAFQFCLFAPVLIFSFWKSAELLVKSRCRSLAIEQAARAALAQTVNKARLKPFLSKSAACGFAIDVPFSLGKGLDYE